MAKEFTYKGKTLEELKKMDLKELAVILPSRARRSINRGFTEAQKKFLKNIDRAIKEDSKKPVKTHCRDMLILPKMVGLKISIHNGKSFVLTEIPQEAIGMYLGELVQTRTKVGHSSPGVGATRSSSALSVR